MDQRVSRAIEPMHGTLEVPSDKSISHRAVLFAGMAEGVSMLTRVLNAADLRASIAALHWLGAGVRVLRTLPEGMTIEIRGWGERGPKQPYGPVDCGNSGTTLRLVMGILAGWPVEVTLTGDDSLSKRPLRRVADPLEQMGARVHTSDAGTLPVTVRGSSLKGIAYSTPVASAQVKTALLLAGLRAEGTTSITEPAASRDHTERLLPAFGVPVVVDAATHTVSVTGPVMPQAFDLAVPGDPSSAAFHAVAAALLPGSDIALTGISVNPTRTGFIRVLERMGASVRIEELPAAGEEPTGTLHVSFAPLSATTISAEEIPSLVDEVPVLALAATQANGTTRFEGVAELRVKESDRLAAIVTGLRALGATVEAGEDWLEVTGPTALTGTSLTSAGDHRLAMTWAIAGLVARGESVVEGFDAVEVSYPRFQDDVEALLGRSLCSPAC